MFGTFFGLNTALTGLQTQQAAVEVTAHNISNANTPGYSRQRADMTASTPLSFNSGTGPIYVGTGVQIGQITRSRDAFLDQQYRDENQFVGEWQTKQSTMESITSIVNEPSDTGLSSVMQTFWNAWEKVGTTPGLAGAMELRQDAISVTGTLNQMSSQYTQLSNDLDNNLSTTVSQANSLLSQIAAVNQEVGTAQQLDGQGNNDLLDQRDGLLDKLSQIANISVDQSGGSFKLSVGGYVAVQDNQVVRNLAVPPAGQQGAQPSNQIWTSNVSGGQIKGITDSIQSVATYQNYLDNFAQQLATGPMDIQLAGTWQFPQDGTSQANVSGTLPDGTTFSSAQSLTNGHGVTVDNSSTPPLITVPAGTTVHVNGLNGLLQLGYSTSGQVTQNFFTEGSSSATPNITAANITVGVSADQIGIALRPTLQTDTQGNKTWSATSPGLDGDGTLANTANGLQNSNLTFPDPSTSPSATNPNPTLNGSLNEFLQAVVGRVGIDTQTAQRQVTNQNALLQQVDTKRQSVSGVSIDEEMANMVKFQQAYSASAKMITTIDQMLSTLINSTGNVSG